MKKKITEEMEQTTFTCNDCGKIMEGEPEYENPNGKPICEDCNDNYSICDDCGERVLSDETHTAWTRNGDEIYICEDCMDNYSTCCDCDHLVPSDTTYSATSRRGGEITICPSCREDDYFSCGSCGEIFHSDNMHGDYYCEHCYEEDSSEYENIRECHDNPTLVYQPVKKNGLRYFGFELEIDQLSDNGKRELSDKLADYQNNKFFMKEDGSLNCGFEIVSMPCTYDYLYNEFPFEKIIEDCLNYDARSHNGGTCGLHVHINKSSFKNQDLAQVKFLYLFEKFWIELLAFSRRGHELNFCRKNFFDIKGGNLMKKSKISQESRYYAVNFTPRNTIEIRLWRGTLKLTTLMACLQMTALLSEIADNDSIMQLQKMAFDDIVKRSKVAGYKELYAYLTKTVIETAEGEK